MINFKLGVLLALFQVGLLLTACNNNSGQINNNGNGEAKNSANANSTVASTSNPNMVLIPAGEFTMGSDAIDASGKSEEFGFNEPWYLPEHPKHKVILKSYWIDKYEVTNAEFKQFLIRSRKYNQAQLQTIHDRLKMNDDSHPVRIVTWMKAQEYCQSVGKRLPTESEWEKAARGTDGREFPWGNEWKPENLNAGQNEKDLMPVGSFEAGKSPYGLYDMQGNVMEWTADWYNAYEGAKYKSPFYGQQRRVARGGGWGGVGHYVIPHYFRVAYRYNFPPDGAFDDVGFRCAKDA